MALKHGGWVHTWSRSAKWCRDAVAVAVAELEVGVRFHPVMRVEEDVHPRSACPGCTRTASGRPGRWDRRGRRTGGRSRRSVASRNDRHRRAKASVSASPVSTWSHSAQLGPRRAVEQVLRGEPRFSSPEDATVGVLALPRTKASTRAAAGPAARDRRWRGARRPGRAHSRRCRRRRPGRPGRARSCWWPPPGSARAFPGTARRRRAPTGPAGPAPRPPPAAGSTPTPTPAPLPVHGPSRSSAGRHRDAGRRTAVERGPTPPTARSPALAVWVPVTVHARVSPTHPDLTRGAPKRVMSGEIWVRGSGAAEHLTVLVSEVRWTKGRRAGSRVATSGSTIHPRQPAGRADHRRQLLRRTADRPPPGRAGPRPRARRSRTTASSPS